VIHSRYSRLWLGLKAAKVAFALACFLLANSAARSAGIGIGFLGCFLGRSTLTPLALSSAAFFV